MFLLSDRQSVMLLQGHFCGQAGDRDAQQNHQQGVEQER